MTTLDTGRISAIIKIMDRASLHLHRAALQYDGASGASAPSAPAYNDATTRGIQSLLEISQNASASLQRALQYVKCGDFQQAHAQLVKAGTTRPHVCQAPALMPRPLPSGVTTAMCLMRGVSGFFTAETEQAFAPAGELAGRGGGRPLATSQIGA